jgi:hypothetical protein
MGSQNNMFTYVGKARRPKAGGGGFTDWCDYIFKVQGYQAEVRVGMTCRWHDVIPSLGRTLTDEELIAITKEFLGKEMGRRSAPSSRLDISSSLMEYRVRNGSFPD